MLRSSALCEEDVYLPLQSRAWGLPGSGSREPGVRLVARQVSLPPAWQSVDEVVEGPPPRARRARKKVLIVEDDDYARQTLSLILEAEGLAAAMAANGREALEQMRQTPLPSLVLLDLVMPVMDGWEFCRLRAQDARLVGVPVVVISGVDPAGRSRAAPAGISGCLRKPYLVEEVLRVIERVT